MANTNEIREIVKESSFTHLDVANATVLGSTVYIPVVIDGETFYGKFVFSTCDMKGTKARPAFDLNVAIERFNEKEQEKAEKARAKAEEKAAKEAAKAAKSAK